MSDTARTRPGFPPGALTPPADPASVVAEYLGHVVAGTPYPDALRPPAAPPSRPTSVEEELRRTVDGPAG